MESATVSGRFIRRSGEAVAGTVRFVPSLVWVEEGDTAYPVLAPEVELVDGVFVVELTRTDQHGGGWNYVIDCPMGKYPIVIEGPGPHLLKDLLPKKAA